MTAFSRRGVCPALSAPMQTGDGLLVRLNPVAEGISPNVLIGLCESAAHHGNGIVEVTARGSLQIRGLTAESAPLLAAEVDSLGIAIRTGVPVETGPLAGLDSEEIADPRPLAERIREKIEAAGLASRLGPKVSVVVDGGGRLTMDTVLADVRLVAERHEALTERHDAHALWRLSIAGDGRTTNPLALLPEMAAADAALAILAAIAALGRKGRARDLGEQQIRELATEFELRRYFSPPSVLLDISPSRGEVISGQAAPDFGRPKLAKAAIQPISPLEGEMAGRPEGSRTRLSRTSVTPLGDFALADGLHALGIALPFGSMPSEKLIALANAAASRGATEVRFAPQRALLLLGLPKTAFDELRNIASSLGFVTDTADPRTKIAACPGAPACASGHIATRDMAEEIARESGGLIDASFSLHISGCAKGCAHPAEATLTLVGGEKGAGLVVSGTAKGLPAAYMPGYEAARGLGRVAELLRNQRQPGENTASCVARLGKTRIAAAFQQEHDPEKLQTFRNKIMRQNKELERDDESFRSG